MSTWLQTIVISAVLALFNMITTMIFALKSEREITILKSRINELEHKNNVTVDVVSQIQETVKNLTPRDQPSYEGEEHELED